MAGLSDQDLAEGLSATLDNYHIFFWAVMVAIIVRSPGRISMSQPACRKKYGLQGWITLLWSLPYLMQLIILIGGLNLPVPFGVSQVRNILWYVIFVSVYGRLSSLHRTPQSSLLEWTNNSYVLAWPKGRTYRLFRFILLVKFQVSLSSLGQLLPFVGPMGALGSLFLIVVVISSCAEYRKQLWHSNRRQLALESILVGTVIALNFIPFQLLHVTQFQLLPF